MQIFLVAILCLLLGGRSTIAQEQSQGSVDYFVYLDNSKTVFRDSKPTSPHVRIGEMLKTFFSTSVDNQKVTSSRDKIHLYLFGERVSQEGPAIAGGSSPDIAQTIDALVSSKKKSEQTLFDILFSAIRTNPDIRRQDGRTKVILIASDFVHDDNNEKSVCRDADEADAAKVRREKGEGVEPPTRLEVVASDFANGLNDIQRQKGGSGGLHLGLIRVANEEEQGSKYWKCVKRLVNQNTIVSKLEAEDRFKVNVIQYEGVKDDSQRFARDLYDAVTQAGLPAPTISSASYGSEDSGVSIQLTLSNKGAVPNQLREVRLYADGQSLPPVAVEPPLELPARGAPVTWSGKIDQKTGSGLLKQASKVEVKVRDVNGTHDRTVLKRAERRLTLNDVRFADDYGSLIAVVSNPSGPATAIGTVTIKGLTSSSSVDIPVVPPVAIASGETKNVQVALNMDGDASFALSEASDVSVQSGTAFQIESNARKLSPRPSQLIAVKTAKWEVIKPDVFQLVAEVTNPNPYSIRPTILFLDAGRMPVEHCLSKDKIGDSRSDHIACETVFNLRDNSTQRSLFDPSQKLEVAIGAIPNVVGPTAPLENFPRAALVIHTDGLQNGISDGNGGETLRFTVSNPGMIFNRIIRIQIRNVDAKSWKTVQLKDDQAGDVIWGDATVIKSIDYTDELKREISPFKDIEIQIEDMTGFGRYATISAKRSRGLSISEGYFDSDKPEFIATMENATEIGITPSAVFAKRNETTLPVKIVDAQEIKGKKQVRLDFSPPELQRLLPGDENIQLCIEATIPFSGSGCASARYFPAPPPPGRLEIRETPFSPKEVDGYIQLSFNIQNVSPYQAKARAIAFLDSNRIVREVEVQNPMTVPPGQERTFDIRVSTKHADWDFILQATAVAAVVDSVSQSPKRRETPFSVNVLDVKVKGAWVQDLDGNNAVKYYVRAQVDVTRKIDGRLNDIAPSDLIIDLAKRADPPQIVGRSRKHKIPLKKGTESFVELIEVSDWTKDDGDLLISAYPDETHGKPRKYSLVDEWFIGSVSNILRGFFPYLQWGIGFFAIYLFFHLRKYYAGTGFTGFLKKIAKPAPVAGLLSGLSLLGGNVLEVIINMVSQFLADGHGVHGTSQALRIVIILLVMGTVFFSIKLGWRFFYIHSHADSAMDKKEMKSGPELRLQYTGYRLNIFAIIISLAIGGAMLVSSVSISDDKYWLPGLVLPKGGAEVSSYTGISTETKPAPLKEIAR